MKPLKLRTIAILIASVFLTTSGAVVYLFNKNVNERSAKAFQESSRSWAKRNILENVKGPLAYGSKDELRAFALHYVKHPEIFEIIINDYNGDQLAFARDSDNKKKSFGHSEIIEVKQRPSDTFIGDFSESGDITLGSINVIFSYDFSDQVVKEGLLATFTIVLAATVFMILCFYVAIRSINKHLKLSNDQAESISKGDFVVVDEQSMILELKTNTNYLNGLSKTLEKMIEELKSTSTVKSKLLSMASHDLRQPLNSVMPQLDVIVSKIHAGYTIDTSLLQQIKAIYSSLRVMSVLMDELSDYNAIKFGKLKLVRTVFVPETVFDDAFRSISQNSKSNLQLNLEADHSSKLGANSLIETDRSKLTSIIVNLLDNAFKYTWAGSITLRWGFADGEDGQVSLTFEVSDTGSGISAEQKTKIFEEYYQSDINSEGWGLGLPKVARFLELLDGKIDLQSSLGRGSSFTVTIPIRFHEKESFRANISLPDETKFMVVDDNIGNCLMMKEMLELYGAKVSYFLDPFEALKASKDRSFTAAFVDYWMPGMDGVDLAERIHIENNHFDQMSIICVTGYDTPEILAELETFSSKEYGIFDGYIRKPIDKEQVETVLSNLVHKPTKGEKFTIKSKVVELYPRGKEN